MAAMRISGDVVRRAASAGTGGSSAQAHESAGPRRAGARGATLRMAHYRTIAGAPEPHAGVAAAPDPVRPRRAGEPRVGRDTTLRCVKARALRDGRPVG
jgi:hypothetical protein